MRRWTQRAHSRPRVAIVGGTIAGMAAAVSLPKHYDVTVIDPLPYLEWSPNTYQLLSGYKKAEHLRVHKGKLLRQRHHRLLLTDAVSIDYERRKIVLAQGQPVDFDYAVVALGSESMQRSVPGADDYASDIRSIYQCNHIAHRLSRAEVEGRHYCLAIVGSGIEAVSALGEVLRRYRSSESIDIQVIHSAHRLLPRGPESLHLALMQLMEDLPVNFHFGVKVTQVHSDYIELNTGRLLQKKMAIWAGRRLPSSHLQQLGLVDGPRQRVSVNGALQSLTDARIYAIGESCDAVSLEASPSEWIEMGEYVAMAIERGRLGESLDPWFGRSMFRFVPFGDLANFMIYKDYMLQGALVGHLNEMFCQVNMAKVQPMRGISGLLAAGSRFHDGLLKHWFELVANPRKLMQLPEIKKFQ